MQQVSSQNGIQDVNGSKLDPDAIKLEFKDPNPDVGGVPAEKKSYYEEYSELLESLKNCPPQMNELAGYFGNDLRNVEKTCGGDTRVAENVAARHTIEYFKRQQSEIPSPHVKIGTTPNDPPVPVVKTNMINESDKKSPKAPKGNGSNGSSCVSAVLTCIVAVLCCFKT